MTALSLVRLAPVDSVEVPVGACEEYGSQLLAYIADRLPAYHWHLAEDLAQDTWEHALAHADLTTGGIDEEEAGLPVWLATTARTVIRRHLTPTVLEDGTPQAVVEPVDDGHASAVPAALAA